VKRWRETVLSATWMMISRASPPGAGSGRFSAPRRSGSPK
jgi:hypothetical protein